MTSEERLMNLQEQLKMRQKMISDGAYSWRTRARIFRSISSLRREIKEVEQIAGMGKWVTP